MLALAVAEPGRVLRASLPTFDSEPERIGRAVPFLPSQPVLELKVHSPEALFISIRQERLSDGKHSGRLCLGVIRFTDTIAQQSRPVQIRCSASVDDQPLMKPSEKPTSPKIGSTQESNSIGRIYLRQKHAGPFRHIIE